MKRQLEGDSLNLPLLFFQVHVHPFLPPSGLREEVSLPQATANSSHPVPPLSYFTMFQILPLCSNDFFPFTFKCWFLPSWKFPYSMFPPSYYFLCFLTQKIFLRVASTVSTSSAAIPSPTFWNQVFTHHGPYWNHTTTCKLYMFIWSFLYGCMHLFLQESQLPLWFWWQHSRLILFLSLRLFLSLLGLFMYLFLQF